MQVMSMASLSLSAQQLAHLISSSWGGRQPQGKMLWEKLWSTVTEVQLVQQYPLDLIFLTWMPALRQESIHVSSAMKTLPMPLGACVD